MSHIHSMLLVFLATLLFSVHGTSAHASSAESPSLARAQARFEQGLADYRAGRFRSAIQHFLAADRLVPSPALAFNVARSYEKLNEPARELQHYRAYLRRGPDPSNEAQVRARVREIEAWLAERGLQQLTIRSDPTGAALTINGEAQGTTPWTGELEFGKHQVALDDGSGSRVLDIELGPGEAVDVEMSLTDPQRAPERGGAQLPTKHAARKSEPRRHEAEDLSRLAPWFMAGAGAMALSGAAVFELRRRDAESDARSEEYQLAYYEHRDRMLSDRRTARVLAGVGALLVVGAGVIAVVRGGPADSARERASAALACGASACLGTWRGSF